MSTATTDFPPRDHSPHSTSWILAIALVLLLAPALAAQTYPETSAPQIPRAKVSGTVVNSVTGEPISRALVVIEGRSQRNTFTDSEGNFAFDDVISVPLVFYARKLGFLEVNQRERSVVSPKQGESITLKLNPTGLIFGQVTTDDGEPIESTSIQTWTQRVIEGRKQWTPIQNTNTDEDGRFRVAGLSPGKYLVSAGPFNQRELGQEPNGFPTTYYPNAPDRNSATAIQVGIGQQVEANFSLTPVPVYTVMGTVTVPLDQSMGLTIRDSAGRDVGMGTAFNRTTGQFRVVGVPRGTYTIEAHSYGPPGDIMTGRATVTLTASRDGVVVPLHPAIRIPVEVHREDIQRSAPQQQPAERGMIIGRRRQFADPDVQVRAIPLNRDAQENVDWAVRDQQGRMVLRSVEPGSYRIVVMPLGEYYVQSVSSGGVDLLSEPLVISESGTVEPIEVVLRNDAAKLKAKVRGNDGYGAAIAIPVRDFQPPVIGNYSSEGECFFPPLAPGTYRLYAFDRGVEEIEYANRDAMEPYDSKSVQVTLTPNQTTEATVDVIKVAQ